MKAEVAVIGSPSLMSIQSEHAVRTGLRSYVKVEVTVLGSPSLIVRRVSGCKATLDKAVWTQSSGAW